MFPRALLPFISALVVLGCGGHAAPQVGTAPASASSSRTPAPKQLRIELSPRRSQTTHVPEIDALGRELQRALAELGKLPDPPYFLGYQIVDSSEHVVSASYGGLLESREDKGRSLDIDLRLGDHSRDNTHTLSGDEGLSSYRGKNVLPLEDNGIAFATAIWRATNREYELARQDLMRVRSEVELKSTAPEEAPGPNFTREPPSVYLEQPLTTTFDRGKWEAGLSAASEIAAAYPHLLESAISLSFRTELSQLVNSDGSRVQLAARRARISLSAQTLTQDGMRLERYDSIDSRSISPEPDVSLLSRRFEQLLDELTALSRAPVVEPYVGPAILDGRAAGVFFHEILGHRLEGHRQDSKAEGQTFAKRVGQRIMPARLNVYDDPRVSKLNDAELAGYYAFDDEGVPAQRASLVEDGVLSGFLMSRSPTRGFTRSNGHGRKQAGHRVVARQANLVVDPIEPITPKALKHALLLEVQRQGLDYGLRFSEISGGYTQTQRFDTQAFKVVPVMVYRVFLDGTEELVRGVDIEGTPLLALSKVVAVANDFQVFNGVCGAESGWVPVSAVSPSLLLAQVEVARREQTEFVPPILEPPLGTRGPVP